MRVRIFTDGACLGNPGPGGYGVVGISGFDVWELSGGYEFTTNVRMEMLAVAIALEFLKIRCIGELHTDSKLIVDAINKGWLERWICGGWKKSDGRRVENQDLWKRIYDAIMMHDFSIKWIKGHAGNIDNERADFLAGTAAAGSDLEIDHGYERRLIIEGSRLLDRPIILHS